MEIYSFKGKKRVFSRKPLFPGYLFACFDPDEAISKVKWTRGVNKILPESTNPVPLEDSVVESIKSLASKDNIIRKRNLKRNNRIRVTRGPMKDLLGIFENWVSDQGRVKILLNLVNYQARVELHHSLIEKVA